MQSSTDGETGAIPIHLVLGTLAKVLCSAVFVSGRDNEFDLRNSTVQALLVHHLDRMPVDMIEVDVDRDERQVTASLKLDRDSAVATITAYRSFHQQFEFDWDAEAERLVQLGKVSRTARFVGDQGSVILPRDGAPLRFEPTRVTSMLPPAQTQDWPMGDRTDTAPRSTVDRAAVARAIDGAFIDEAYTAAVVVLHQGELVGERYRDGYDLNTQLESWSMGKSLTGTLAGVLVQQGHLTLDESAPVEAWQGSDDPRRDITVRDLLQMSGGLRFSGQDDPRGTWRHGVPDHLYIYTEAMDAFAFAVDHPAEVPPGTRGRYLNCDPLAIGSIIKQIVTGPLGQDYLSWPQAALFDRIGIRRQVMETDLHGNFLLTGFDYGTARNWARIGLLYLRDGLWNGDQILPPGWTEFVATPAPGWDERRYGGGLFWLNGIGEFDLPIDTYYAAGFGEQRTFIVPSADLVVVRMGNRADTDIARTSTNEMLRHLMSALS